MFTYRKCEKKDADIWIEMNREFIAYESQDDDLWNGVSEVSDQRFSQTFEEALSSPELISLLILEEDGKPVGFANLMTIFSVWSHGKALYLDDLFIREDDRGKGYGKKALEYIEAFAKELGCKRIQFHSEATNPNARQFYTAVGYAPAEMFFYVKYF